MNDFLRLAPSLVAGAPAGVAVAGGVFVTLALPPDLAFAFDALRLDDGAGLAEKDLAGVTLALTADELAAVRAFLASQAAMVRTHVVWGVAEDGTPMGLVDESTAFARSGPQPAGGYRWNFDTRSWDAHP